MEKTTLRMIKTTIETGVAIDITTYNSKQIEKIHKNGYEKIYISFGVNGMNGCIIRDNKTNKLYAIRARNSNLFAII